MCLKVLFCFLQISIFLKKGIGWGEVFFTFAFTDSQRFLSQEVMTPYLPRDYAKKNLKSKATSSILLYLSHNDGNQMPVNDTRIWVYTVLKGDWNHNLQGTTIKAADDKVTQQDKIRKAAIPFHYQSQRVYHITL